AGAARPPPEERDQTDRDPHDRPREPARELVEPKQQLPVRSAVRQALEQRVPLAHDLVEPPLLARLAEDEVVLRRRRPDVADAVVGPQDPQVLAGGDRLALR